ncbi:MAG TPA: NAD-dependent deacylase, partial [Nitrospinaceae bacterium]|nr:NAD-dependent deacylase [Nitrospinaceae bacterium]
MHGKNPHPFPGEVPTAHWGHPPVSPHHPNGLARPDVIWFGEGLPVDAMNRAMTEASNCDVCFSVGTSTLVQPAASLP